jgi:hypothetical protein
MTMKKILLFVPLSAVFVVGLGGFHFSLNRVRERLNLFAPTTAGIWAKKTDGVYSVLFYFRPAKGQTAVDSNYECILSKEGDEVKRIAPTPAPEDRNRYVCAIGSLLIGNYRVVVSEKGKEGKPIKVTEFDVPGPNLRVPAFWVQVAPMKPMKDRPFTVRVSALNNGSVAAKNVLVKVQMLQGAAAIGKPMAIELTELGPGRTSTVSFEIPGLPVGRYLVRATIDPANDIDEVYEKDNESQRKVWVSEKFLLR